MKQCHSERSEESLLYVYLQSENPSDCIFFMDKKTVFLTGATGNMGWAGFQELYARRERFNIRILARDSRKNRRKLKPYLADPSVTVVWGDLMRYEDVLSGVTGADYVLHVGGMVSPAADYYPEKTLKVNVGSAENVESCPLTR